MTWTPPTLAQQRGLSYAQKPLGAMSFLSSCYVIYYIVCQCPEEKRKRLYHRLVLAMNIALLPLSFSHVWGTWAVPAGTPYYVGAAGTINTCTAQGFISNVFMLTVSVYYCSLVLQAYMGIKNNFREEKYKWFGYAVHFVAYGWSLALITVVAATDNMNPGGSGCSYTKSPRGCESDPGVPCERGKDIDFFIYVVGFSQVFFYLIFPPSVILAMYFWIKKMEKKSSTTSHAGMSVLREAFRKQMMQNIYRQMSLYLFSFWLTWVFGLIHFIYKQVTGNPAYNLNIFANCMFALQGFVMMLVYFSLQTMGKSKLDLIQQQSSSPARPGPNRQLTVSDIRASALRKEENVSAENARDSIRSSFNFNIFDGTPNEDSPWAMFINPCSSDEEENEYELNNDVPTDEREQIDQKFSETRKAGKISNGV